LVPTRRACAYANEDLQSAGILDRKNDLRDDGLDAGGEKDGN